MVDYTVTVDAQARRNMARLLAETAADFYTRGWMWGTSGNLSVRIQAEPLAFLVTASGRDKGRLSADDMLLVGAEGAALENWKGKPSAEMPVHERIYRLFDAGAVYHVHTVMGTVVSDCCADQGGLTLNNIEMLKGFGHDGPEVTLTIPIVDNDADSHKIADHVERGAKPGVPGVLIRNHGLYAWGRTPEETRNHVEVFEYLFNFAWHRALLRDVLSRQTRL